MPKKEKAAIAEVITESNDDLTDWNDTEITVDTFGSTKTPDYDSVSKEISKKGNLCTR